MRFEVALRLDDDEAADHEARRLLLQTINRGQNFLPEGDGVKPLRIFNDHKNPIFEEQLFTASQVLRAASEYAKRAGSAHGVKGTVAKQQGISGADLEAIESEGTNMQAACNDIAQELADARELVFKWYRELHAQNRARIVGAAAIAAMAEAPQ